MTVIVEDIKVDTKELEKLIQFKNEQYELKKQIHNDIFPALVEGFRQIRELILNIAIISGAIASFTIPVIGSQIIQIKSLAYGAIFLLFITICYAIYHLSEIIPSEVNALSKQHRVYNDLIDESIDRINRTISTGDFEELKRFDKNDILNRLNSIKVPEKTDKSLSRLRSVFFIAIGFLSLSFLSPINIGSIFSKNLKFNYSLFVFNGVDVVNNLVGGVVGFLLVKIFDFFYRPRIVFGKFIKLKGLFGGKGDMFKLLINIKGTNHPGLSQLKIIINEGALVCYAKWDEKPNPLIHDNIDAFVPESVPDTQYLNTYSGQNYSVPILFKDTSGKLAVFNGWWFGINKGYAQDQVINEDSNIQFEFISQNVSAKSRKYRVGNIIKETA